MQKCYLKLLNSLEIWARQAGIAEVDWQLAVFQDITECGTKLTVAGIEQDKRYCHTKQVALCGDRVVCMAACDKSRSDTIFIYKIYPAEKYLPKSVPTIYEGLYYPFTLGEQNLYLDDVKFLFDTVESDFAWGDEVDGVPATQTLPGGPLLKALGAAPDPLRKLWRPINGSLPLLAKDEFLAKLRLLWNRFRVKKYVNAPPRLEGLIKGHISPTSLDLKEQGLQLQIFNFDLLNSLAKEDSSSINDLLTIISKMPVSETFRAAVWSCLLTEISAEALIKELSETSSIFLSYTPEHRNIWAPYVVDAITKVSVTNMDTRLKQVLENAELETDPLWAIAQWANKLLMTDGKLTHDEVFSKKPDDTALTSVEDVSPDPVKALTPALSPAFVGEPEAEAMYNAWLFRICMPDASALNGVADEIVNMANKLYACTAHILSVEGITQLSVAINDAQQTLTKCDGILPDLRHLNDDVDEAKHAWEGAWQVLGIDVGILVEEGIGPKEMEEISEVLADKDFLELMPNWVWTWGNASPFEKVTCDDLKEIARFLCIDQIRRSVTAIRDLCRDTDEIGLEALTNLAPPSLAADIVEYFNRALEQIEESKLALREIADDQKKWVELALDRGGDCRQILALSREVESLRQRVNPSVFYRILQEIEEQVDHDGRRSLVYSIESAITFFETNLATAKDASYEQLARVGADQAKLNVIPKGQRVKNNVQIIPDHNWVDARRKVPLHFTPYKGDGRPYGCVSVPVLLVADEPIDAHLTLHVEVSTRHRSAWPSDWENPSPSEINVPAVYWRFDGKQYVYSVKLRIPIRNPAQVKGNAFEFDLTVLDAETAQKLGPGKNFRWDHILVSSGPVRLNWPDGVRTEWVTTNPVGPQKCADEIFNRIEGFSSFATVAPRRFGKTTLVEYLREKAIEEGFLVPPTIVCTSHSPYGGTIDYGDIWQAVSDYLQENLGAAITRTWEEEGLPDPNAFDFVRRAAKAQKKKGILILFDEAHILFPRHESKGHVLGDKFKDRIERYWARQEADMVSLVFGFIGLPGLQDRAGTNLMGLLRPIEQLSGIHESDLLSLVKNFSQDSLHLTKEARNQLVEKSGNLFILKTLMEKLVIYLNDEERKWAYYDDCVFIEEGIKDRLSSGREQQISSYVRDALNDADTVNTWRPKACYPLAVALEKVSREGTKDTRIRLSDAKTALNNWCEVMQAEDSSRLIYTTDRVDEHFRTLQELGVLAKNEFRSGLLAAWLAGKAIGFPQDQEDRNALFRGAMKRIRTPQVLEPMGGGSQASIWRFSDKETGISYALRKMRLGGKRARDRFLDSVETMKILMDRSSFREEGTDYIFELKDIGLADDDETVGVEIYRWIDGISLNNKVKELQAPFVADLGLKISKALHWLHKHNVIHRDIHPRNIILSDEGSKPILIDFGLARLMDVQLNTPIPAETAAPEVNCKTPRWNKSADIYSLGKTLEMIMANNEGSELLDPILQACITQDSDARPDAAELVKMFTDLNKKLHVKELRDKIWTPVVETAGVDLEKKWFKEVVFKFRPRIESIALGLHRAQFDKCAEIAAFLDQILEASPYKKNFALLKKELWNDIEETNKQSISFLHNLRIERSHVDERKSRETILRQFGRPNEEQMSKWVNTGAEFLSKFLELESLPQIIRQLM